MQLPHNPLLGLCIKPRFDAEGACGLFVHLRVQVPAIDALQPMFVFDTFTDNIPGHPYTESSICASDDLGSLDFKFVDLPSTGRNTQQHWCPRRATSGEVILNLTVEPRKVDIETPVGARIDLRREHGGLLAAGRWFLPRLISDKIHTNVVQWELPSDAPNGTRCIWSFGEGCKPIVKIGRSDTLWNTIYMVGPVRSYPENQHAGVGSATTYWFGSLEGELNRLKGYNTELHPRIMSHYKISNESYRVFVRKVLSGFGGTGFIGSFVLEYDDKIQTATDHQIKALFTHEMVHSFSTMHAEDDGYDNAWFNEGIAELYASILPYRFGLCDRDYAITDLNSHLQGYFTNPRINMNIRDAVTQFFSDWYAVWIPYKRGCVYLILVDYYLRHKTQRYDILQPGPLDEIVIDMALRTRNGESIRSADWLEYLQRYLDDDDISVKEQFSMILGGHTLDLSGMFIGGPMSPLLPRQLHVLDFGFDKSSLRARTVSGLVEGSAAARAGLKNGAKILTTSDHNRCTENMQECYELLVEMGGNTQLIKYLPRTEKTVLGWLLEC